MLETEKVAGGAQGTGGQGPGSQGVGDQRNAKPAKQRRLGRRFAALLGLSLALHLLFTPLGAWLGAGLVLFEQLPEPESPAPEQLGEIPIELSEFLAPEPETVAPLPAEDPVAFIEQTLPALPPTATALADDPEHPKVAVSAAPVVSVSPLASVAPVASVAVSATAPLTASPSVAPTLPPARETAAPVAANSSQPSSAPHAAAAPSTAPSVDPAAIDDPVLLAGRASALEKSPSNVAVTLYTDRIRGHALGQRVAELLPRLPQWDDFFGDGNLNPIRDFDRVAMFGPSFARSGDLVVAVQYNAPASRVRAAVDRLVTRRGSWLPKQPIPIAQTFADRAERVVMLPKKGFALVIPPALKEQALKANLSSVPPPKGNEAAVISLSSPRAPLLRLGFDVPASISRVRGKITPLPDGSVELSIVASDADPDAARADAAQLTRTINAGIRLLTGVSNVLSRLGFGGFASGAEFDEVQLEARGTEIYGRQVLTPAQVGFILDRVERQVIAQQRQRERAEEAAPPAAPEPRNGKRRKGAAERAP